MGANRHPAQILETSTLLRFTYCYPHPAATRGSQCSSGDPAPILPGPASQPAPLRAYNIFHYELIRVVIIVEVHH